MREELAHPREATIKSRSAPEKIALGPQVEPDLSRSDRILEMIVGNLVGRTGHYLNSDYERTVAVLALLKAHSPWRG